MHLERLVRLKPEEEILEVVREDVRPWLPRFAFFGLLFLVPFFFLFPLWRQGWLGAAGFFLLVGFAILAFLRTYRRWSRTLLVITDRRIVDLEQKGLFHRVASEAMHGDIEEASYRIKGFWPTLLGMGELRLERAGGAADLVFARVKHPARIHDLLNDLRAGEPPEDPRQRRLRELSERLSPDEMEAVAAEARRRERDRAIEEVYGNAEDA